MGIKDEIKAAKEVAARLQCEGNGAAKIATTLNLAYEGFYYVVGRHVYREATQDYLPATQII